MHAPLSPAWDNFSIMMEYTPESGRCHSVCNSVGLLFLFDASEDIYVPSVSVVHLQKPLFVAKILVFLHID